MITSRIISGKIFEESGRLPNWLTMLPMYLWILVFFTRPHKVCCCSYLYIFKKKIARSLSCNYSLYVSCQNEIISQTCPLKFAKKVYKNSYSAPSSEIDKTLQIVHKCCCYAYTVGSLFVCCQACVSGRLCPVGRQCKN